MPGFPSILSCSWPAFHPKDTTKVIYSVCLVHNQSPSFICNTSESEDLKLNWKVPKSDFCNFYLTKLFDKASTRCLLSLEGFTQLIRTNKQTKKKKMTNLNTYSDGSCHCTSPTKLSYHSKPHTFLWWAPDYYHFAKWEESLGGWGAVKGFYYSLFKTWLSKNKSKEKLATTRSVVSGCGMQTYWSNDSHFLNAPQGLPIRLDPLVNAGKCRCD